MGSADYSEVSMLHCLEENHPFEDADEQDHHFEDHNGLMIEN